MINNNINILLVDDDKTFSIKLQGNLISKPYYYNVDICNTSQDALVCYKTKQHNVLVIDIFLTQNLCEPELGLYLASQLSKLSIGKKKPLIIFMSRLVTVEAHEAAESYGGAFIEKSEANDVMEWKIDKLIVENKRIPIEVLPKRSKPEIVKVGKLVINISKQSVFFRNKKCDLNARQYHLMKELALKFYDDEDATISIPDMAYLYTNEKISLEDEEQIYNPKKTLNTKSYQNISSAIRDLRLAIGLTPNQGIVCLKKDGYKLQYVD